eukprot:COSAG01_NODE_12106_length_1800_cov_1.310406_1_plen_389_part_00
MGGGGAGGGGDGARPSPWARQQPQQQGFRGGGGLGGGGGGAFGGAGFGDSRGGMMGGRPNGLAGRGGPGGGGRDSFSSGDVRSQQGGGDGHGGGGRSLDRGSDPLHRGGGGGRQSHTPWQGLDGDRNFEVRVCLLSLLPPRTPLLLLCLSLPLVRGVTCMIGRFVCSVLPGQARMPEDEAAFMAEFAQKHHAAGINFDKYNDIQVETSGRDVPEHKSSFKDLNLGRVLQRNINFNQCSKPMSSMRSASSSTRKMIWCRDTRLRSIRSTSRPGVATCAQRRRRPRGISTHAITRGRGGTGRGEAGVATTHHEVDATLQLPHLLADVGATVGDHGAQAGAERELGGLVLDLRAATSGRTHSLGLGRTHSYPECGVDAKRAHVGGQTDGPG